MSDGSRSITPHAQACLYLFKAISSNLQSTGFPYQTFIPLSDFHDEFGRFSLWLEDSEALREGPRSLDRRLSESSYVSVLVLHLLKDLRQALEEVLSIVSNKRPQRTFTRLNWSSSTEDDDASSSSSKTTESDSSAETQLSLILDSTTELNQLFQAIKETLGSLFKLFYLIQNPSPRNRYTQAASTTSYSEPFDVNHVGYQYPHVRSTDWLLRRLGKANARRRQFFRLREAQHESLTQLYNPLTGTVDEEVAVLQPESASVTASTLASRALTSSSQVATDYTSSYNSNDDETRSETSSYGTSVNSAEDHSPRVPPPPKESMNRRPFQCQYCYDTIIVKDARSWRKHVYSDLTPYICTFEGCALKMFAERHTWFEHELHIHRREWICILCPYSSQEKASFENHLYMQHYEHYTEAQLPMIMMKCELPIKEISTTACPFCDDWTYPMLDHARPSTNNDTERATKIGIKQFYKHVGRHMEDLALFVLPQRYDAPDSDSSDSDDSGEDNDSDSDSDAQKAVTSKRDRQGRTALARACAALRVDEVWRCIKESPQDIDVPDYAGNTPLQIASGVGDVEIIQALIDSKCSTKCRNKVWNTPLMDAAMNGHSMAVFKLMAAGMSCSERNADGKVALDMLDPTVPDYETIKMALTYGGTDTTQSAEKSDQEPENNGWESDEDDTPLNRQFIIAVGIGTEDEARELLEQGANPNTKHYRDPRTRIRALDLAAMVNRPYMISLLLRYGADINLVAPGVAVILVAANLVDPLRLLLENGLDINITWSDWVETALSCAADRGQVETVRMLLAFHADPNQELAKKPLYQLWPTGRPPLNCAAANGSEEIAEMLLAAGADIQMPSVSNSNYTPLHHAAATGQLQMVRLLIRHGADIEATDDDGTTPLLVAITCHREHVYHELVSRGACIHAQNDGRTLPALAIAADQGQIPIMEDLLSRGADIDSYEPRDGTPLHRAAAREYKGTIELLLKRGANTHLKNQWGSTALNIVIHSGRMDLAALWASFARDGGSASGLDGAAA